MYMWLDLLLLVTASYVGQDDLVKVDAPASTSWLLGLWASTTMLSYFFPFYEQIDTESRELLPWPMLSFVEWKAK